MLATDKVRFQGQEVAFVIAEDKYSARDALELIDVDYEILAAGRRRQDGTRPRRSGDPHRQGGQDRQPHLRLGGRRQGQVRRGVRQRRRDRQAGHALPAGAPVADGDVRRGGAHGQDHRPADDLLHHPGAARPPHDLRHGGRLARAEDPRGLARHRRRLRQQGRHLLRVRAGHRRLDRHRQAGEVDGGPQRAPDVHGVRPRLPHARRDRRDQGRQDPRRPRRRVGRPRLLQRHRPTNQVPGRVLPHLHRLLRLRGRALQGHRACTPTRRRAVWRTPARSGSPRRCTWSSGWSTAWPTS